MVLEVDGVSCRIDQTLVLSNISFRIDRGEFVLVVGANGSGKTTLLDICNGLRDPTDGAVYIDGVAVAEDPVHARSAVGRVFEDPRDQLLCATVAADVGFGPANLGVDPDTIDRRVEHALCAVGMSDRGDDAIDTLSGGERARVAIAGALAVEPKILALDEPTTGLDHPGRTSVFRHIQAANDAGMTVVFATHDLRDLYVAADRIIALADGRLALDCSPAEATDRLPGLGVRVPSEWARQ